ncbi:MULTISPECIES: VOC family protein [unclassified Streptomyces]|uniref:VOC family protein n=1 Tax=unclassified Streptomyces TaxID=2593676 RepID=UPI000DDB161B|nr:MULTISPECIES: VOC family protein [unclassified Streptomyces]QZZ29084.1 hypothetical protein A7X85_25040 [Streptomyces sp. ST1015]
MSRVQLARRVSDLEASIAFYAKLFGTEPAKRRAGYADFAIAEPPLKLVLIESGPGEEPWEVYVVKADADTLGGSAAEPGATGDGCCAGPAASGCGCGTRTT